MIVYIITLLTSIIIAKIGLSLCKNERKNRWIVAVLSSLPFIIISTLRYDVGTDYFSYMSIYDLIGRGVDVDSEWLFVLLNRLCYFVSNGSYIFFLFVTSILFFVPLFMFIFYYSSNPILSIILMVVMVDCFYFFNGMRQMISASFVLLSLHFVNKKNILMFVLCILIAGGMHNSSYVFGLLYFIKDIKLSRISIIFIIILLFVFNALISSKIIEFVSRTQYNDYILGSEQQVQTIRLLVNIFILAFYLLFFKKNIKNKYSIYFIFQIISIYSILLSSKIEWAQRLAWTSNLPSLIFIPIVIDNMKIQSNKRISTFIIVILFTIYVIYYCLISGMQDVFPYQTVFGHLI